LIGKLGNLYRFLAAKRKPHRTCYSPGVVSPARPN
jgi:hypothetical protein